MRHYLKMKWIDEKKICYYNINISLLGGLIGKASRCIVLCTFLRNHFDM